MKRFIPMLLASALFVCAGATLVTAAETGAAPFEARVVHVVDGDTLDVMGTRKRLRVRLAGIDAPESGQRYGHRSRQTLIAVCGGELARIDVKGIDPHGRMLAHVSCSGIDAGAEQVRQGMAWVSARTPLDSPLKRLQTQAQAARRGLWADKEPVPPWEWRRDGN